MKLSLAYLSAFASIGSLTAASPAGKVFEHVRDKAPQAPVIGRRKSSRHFENAQLQRRASSYLNSATEKFVVDGTKIPDVDFDIGESYAGLLPISEAANETRTLFFWLVKTSHIPIMTPYGVTRFFPSTNPDASDEIVMWFNGGPGCSSLSGLLTENGKFTWEAGTLQPVENAHSWTNWTNMIWVGYTQRAPNISNEIELGEQMLGFYRNFVNASQVQGRKVYLTGESYAGFYVPYIADAFINANDSTYYNLAGFAINDPILGDSTVAQQIPVLRFVEYWSNLFNLNETFVEALTKRVNECGYTDYLSKYLTFPPPPGNFPGLPDPYASGDEPQCDIFDDVYSAALLANPCFNISHITDTCPHLWSVLGIVNPGDYQPPEEVVYFNRSDVQQAINAPVGTNWMQCTMKNVFGDGSNN